MQSTTKKILTGLAGLLGLVGLNGAANASYNVCASVVSTDLQGNVYPNNCNSGGYGTMDYGYAPPPRPHYKVSKVVTITTITSTVVSKPRHSYSYYRPAPSGRYCPPKGGHMRVAQARKIYHEPAFIW